MNTPIPATFELGIQAAIVEATRHCLYSIEFSGWTVEDAVLGYLEHSTFGTKTIEAMEDLLLATLAAGAIRPLHS